MKVASVKLLHKITHDNSLAIKLRNALSFKGSKRKLLSIYATNAPNAPAAKVNGWADVFKLNFLTIVCIRSNNDGMDRSGR